MSVAALAIEGRRTRVLDTTIFERGVLAISMKRQ